MIKKLAIILSLVLLQGISGTAFAGPFADVPVDNWAYNAVNQLAKDGIITGYSDGTFRGDKPITRYEMAILVAKATERSDKADAADKILINKLAVEYKTELQTLGVRVGKLEQDVNKIKDGFKITGTYDVRYSNKDFTDTPGGNTNQGLGTSGQWRIRLNAVAKVDKDTTINARIVNNSAQQNPANGVFGVGQNQTWTTFGNNSKSTVNTTIDRVWISTKLGEVTTNIGRQPLIVGNTALIVDSGNGTFDGVNFIGKLGQVKGALSYGRLPGYTDISTTPSNQKDITVAELSSSAGKLSGTVGYFGIKNTASNFKFNGVTTNEILKLYYANAKYLFNPKFSINTEFGKNDATYATNDNKFYTLWATLGDQSLNKKGQNNFQVRYYHNDRYALANDGSGAGLNTLSEGVKFGPNSTTFTADHITSTQFLYNYAFSNNLLGQIGYYMGRSDGYSDGNYNLWRTVITARF